jgi:hypothetical protein
MKRFYLLTGIAVFLVISSNGLQAQTPQTKLDQVGLMKQWIGTWQTTVNKDTVQIWEAIPYGKALIINISYTTKGSKNDSYICNIGYDDRDDKIKGFNLFPNTDYLTWIGVFTTDKMFRADALDSFKPEIVWFKNEIELLTPTEMVVRGFNNQGVKTGEWTYKKIK